jgi:hypothetical protein
LERIARQRAGFLLQLAAAAPASAVLAEQRLAATLIFLAVLVTAAAASVELWQERQETAGLQYLAALG